VGRAGFTLIETIVAMLLSSVVIILVSGTFLVQNQYYSAQTLNVSVHENARVATERVAAEVRTAMEDGFVVAGARTLTLRSPVVLGAVCDRAGNDVRVHIEGGVAGLDTDEIAGLALRDPVAGTWEYQNASWSSVNGGSVGSASACAANGADTTSAFGEFHTILGVGTMFASVPDEGDVLMFFRQERAGVEGSQPRLYSIDLTGYNEREIITPTPASDPAWSPPKP